MHSALWIDKLRDEPGGAAGTAAAGFFPGIAKRMLRRMSIELDDRALMLRYQDGDVTAFEILYERHRGPLYRYLLRQVRHGPSAEDIFQEVWGRIIRSREGYRPSAKFTTYMYHIAHNCFIDHCRRSSRQPAGVSIDEEMSIEPVAGGKDPAAQAEIDDMTRRFKESLNELPAEQCDAFLLHEEAGLSLEEIGQVMGVGRETVKSRLRYAVAKLRKSLPAEQSEELTGTHDEH